MKLLYIVFLPGWPFPATNVKNGAQPNWKNFQKIIYSCNAPIPRVRSKPRPTKKRFNGKQQQTRSGGSWEFVGPENIGGRVTDIEIPIDQTQTYYVGAASGGILRPLMGHILDSNFRWQDVLAIGDIAISKNNTSLVWAGTGEPNAGGGSLAYDGDGIYKSTNGAAVGKTKGLPMWKHQ